MSPKKIFYWVLWLLMSLCSVQAQNRGVIPLDNVGSILKPAPFNALVIGISEYHSPSLKLNYARKDAEMFSAFLTASKWSDTVVTLVDSLATASAIYRSIGDLIRHADPGEDVYIYFAGHGDKVGDDILSQAYLLAYDASETRNYEGNGGVIDLTKLELYINKLISVKQCKVYLILDACHSGFDPFEEGALLANNDVSQGFANTYKILSCGPEEYSYELNGLQEGVFTYHLIRGMSGLADQPSNGTISFYELKAYLQHQVPRSAPGPQHPVVIGMDSQVVLGPVSRNLLAQIQGNELLALHAKSRSRIAVPEEDPNARMLALVDGFNRAMELAIYYGDSNAALELIREAEIQEDFPELLQMKMKDLLVERLNLNAQLAINEVLTGKTSLPPGNYFEEESNHLKICLELIDENHPQYESIRVNHLFLKAFSYYRATRFEMYDEAVTLLDSAIHLEKRAAYLYHTKGLILDYRDQYDSAIYYFDLAIDLIPNWKYPINARGNALRASYRYTEAIAEYNRVLAMDSSFYWSYNNLGISYLEMGMLNKAEDYLKQRLSVNGKSDLGVIYSNMAVLANLRGNVKAAEEWYLKAIKEDSLAFYAMNNLGSLYENKLEQPVKGIAFYEEAIRVQPYNSAGYTNLADFYRKRGLSVGDNKLADSLYRHSLRLNPHQNWAWFGYAYLKKDSYNDLNGADSLLKKAKEWNGAKATYWNELGRFYRHTNRNDSAILIFEKAIAIDSFYQYAYGNLSRLYSKEGRKREAEEILKTYTRFNPQNPEVWTQLADFYYAENEIQKSREAYEMALKQDPEFSKAKFSLAVLYLDEGKVAPSIQLYQEAIQENPAELPAGVYKSYALKKIADELPDGKRYEATRQLLALDHYSVAILIKTLQYAYAEGKSDIKVPEADTLIHLEETIPPIKAQMAYYLCLLALDASQVELANAYYKVYKANSPKPDQRVQVVLYVLQGELDKANELKSGMKSITPNDGFSEFFIQTFNEL